jgi:hypothetical protein
VVCLKSVRGSTVLNVVQASTQSLGAAVLRCVPSLLGALLALAPLGCRLAKPLLLAVITVAVAVTGDMACCMPAKLDAAATCPSGFSVLMVVSSGQVNRYGSGLRVMAGPNSADGAAWEVPDFIDGASPFGHGDLPTSPSGPREHALREQLPALSCCWSERYSLRRRPCGIRCCGSDNHVLVRLPMV